MMIEWEEELRNIKYKRACWEVFDPSHMNEISKGNSYIWSGFKFEITELALVNEIVRHHMELESFTNDFFDKFTQSVEKNYRSKHFRRVV